MAEQNYKDFFDEAMSQIRDEMVGAGQEFEFTLNFNFSYIEDTTSEIKVAVPSNFMWRKMIDKGSIARVESKINGLTGQKVTLSPVFKSDVSEAARETSTRSQSIAASSKNSAPPARSPGEVSAERHPQLIEEFTFDNFVPTGEHDYAYNACLAAAKSPGNKNFNPILLYGSSGVGKTHLMVAIGNYIYAQNPKLKIAYITTESLMNEFTASIRERKTDKFTKKYRKLDVLLLDDIQFLEKSEKLQDELFYTFDEIYNRKGQIVFTSDRPLKEINGIVERLKTRFSRGQNIDLKVPDYETRLAIIDKKLEIQEKQIPQEVKELIARTFQSNVRELEGALSKMIGYAELMHKELTLDIAMEQLSDSINSAESGIVSIELIQSIVSDYYNITTENLKSESRKKTYSIPRHIAIYLCRELTEYSQDEIGSEFGGRDHSTVINSCNWVENRLKTGDMTTCDIIKSLTKQITG